MKQVVFLVFFVNNKRKGKDCFKMTNRVDEVHNYGKLFTSQLQILQHALPRPWCRLILRRLLLLRVFLNCPCEVNSPDQWKTLLVVIYITANTAKQDHNKANRKRKQYNSVKRMLYLHSDNAEKIATTCNSTNFLRLISLETLIFSLLIYYVLIIFFLDSQLSKLNAEAKRSIRMKSFYSIFFNGIQSLNRKFIDRDFQISVHFLTVFRENWKEPWCIWSVT